jgi:hypothetical protein
MKAVMLSKKNASHLFDHVIDGFEKSYQGIENAAQLELFNQEEELELLRKNSERLIERIKEWKTLNKIVSIFFAFVFCLMQIAGADLDMRRSSRGRTGRRNETMQTV